MSGDPKRLHLDLKIPSGLFDEWWDPSITGILEKYLSYVESNNNLSMAMLPKGVSPVGFAILAAFKYLPGLQEPPTPFCKIGLFPGARMYNQLRSFRLPSRPFNEVSRYARSLQRGYLKLNGSVEYLEAKQTDYPFANFHWVWRCDRITERYSQPVRAEIMPRSYFGSRDRYNAIIDLLDLEDPGIVHQKYDLFIYCPYYHSGQLGRREEFQKLLAKFKRIKSNKVIILTKSPFDFWSRRFERELNAKGVSLHSLVQKKVADETQAERLKFTVVDQLISFSNATLLFRQLITLKSRFEMLSDEDQFEWRSILKRLFNSVSPKYGLDDLEFISQRFQFLAKTIGLYDEEKVGAIVDSVVDQLKLGKFECKTDHLVSTPNGLDSEIWVTKDNDEKALIEKFEEAGVSSPIILCNRWQKFLATQDRKRVRLSRIEQIADLNWVSYLGSGDELLMTAWEAAVLAQSIDKAWGRALEWKAAAEQLMQSSPSQSPNTEKEDPVFLLADFLLAAKQNIEAVDPHTEESTTTDDSWWQDDSARENHTVVNDLKDLKSAQGTKVPCVEVHFAGNLGTFLRANSYVQVIRGSSEAEFETLQASDLLAGDMILLFKDGERESLFDLLTDQLAESEEWRPHIEIVRKWKLALRTNFFSKHQRISSLLKSLDSHGIKCDGVVARSWIFGGTMAPINIDRTERLAKAVGITGIDIADLFKSVKRIRGISIRLGRLLNQIILGERSGELAEDQVNLIEQVGLDVEEIRAAVDVYKITNISDFKIGIPEMSVRKLFATK